MRFCEAQQAFAPLLLQVHWTLRASLSPLFREQKHLETPQTSASRRVGTALLSSEMHWVRRMAVRPLPWEKNWGASLSFSEKSSLPCLPACSRWTGCRATPPPQAPGKRSPEMPAPAVSGWRRARIRRHRLVRMQSENRTQAALASAPLFLCLSYPEL